MSPDEVARLDRLTRARRERRRHIDQLLADNWAERTAATGLYHVAAHGVGWTNQPIHDQEHTR